MNIKDQVTSLELSQKLKEFEIKQDGYFCWFKLIESQSEYSISEKWQIDDAERFHEISAFTVSELLDILPHRVTLIEGEPFNSFNLKFEKSVYIKSDIKEFTKDDLFPLYRVNYHCDTTGEDVSWMFRPLTNSICDENPANCLAKMIVHLVESGLMKI